MKKQISLIGVVIAGILFTGCGAFHVSVPSTTLKFQPATGALSITSPKDGIVSNLDVTYSQTGSNVTCHATVGSISYILSPTNVMEAANGQTAIINATGTAIANGISASASAVGAVAGATAKTAVKP